MRNKQFIFYFLFSPFILIGIIFILNVIIDPFNMTEYNILHIKYKYARDDRTEKIERVKKIPYISNLILGSSRSQSMNPQIITNTLGGYSYNFGVGGGGTPEALGLLLYLQHKNKLPKNILLVLDFSSFLTDGYHPSFLKIKELNFINKKVETSNQIKKFISIDAVRASFKTLKAHIKKTTPYSYFREDGLSVALKKRVVADKGSKVKYLADKYYKIVYDNGKASVSGIKIKYLKNIVNLCRKNNIHLYVTLSPVLNYQLDLIYSSNFSKVLNSFKKTIASLTPFCDAMIENEYTTNESLFGDSVHFSEKYAEIYMNRILKNNDSDICIDRF